MVKEILSDEQAAFVEMVAAQLTHKFMDELHLFCNRKNYFTHAGILAEIFEWSIEFYDLYYDGFDNFSEPTDVEETVVAFGLAKINGFYTIQTQLDTYFHKQIQELH